MTLTQTKNPTPNHGEFFWQERILKAEVHLFTIVVSIAKNKWILTLF